MSTPRDSSENKQHDSEMGSSARDELRRAEQAIALCALQVRGYEWAGANGNPGDDPHVRLNALTERFINTLRLFDSPEESFAVLFYMQRFVRHWGEGFVDYPNSPLARAAIFLFLELRNQTPLHAGRSENDEPSGANLGTNAPRKLGRPSVIGFSKPRAFPWSPKFPNSSSTFLPCSYVGTIVMQCQLRAIIRVPLSA